MAWNAENVLDALNDFERKPDITPVLEDYLQRIAQNGEIVFPWCKLKPLLKKKLEVVVDEFYESCPVESSVPIPNFESFNFDNLKKTILQAVEAFGSAPFTIQRLCELVTNPQKHYNRTDKYMRGIEKNVLVVSTIDSRIGVQGEGNNGNNPVVNGMLNDSPPDTDSLNGERHDDTANDNSEVSSTNLNTPSNHVLLENFANVFPSAACIPSASDICIKREIDTNFLPSTEDKDLDFSTHSVSASDSEPDPANDEQESDNLEAKTEHSQDELMDIAEDEATVSEEDSKYSDTTPLEMPKLEFIEDDTPVSTLGPQDESKAVTETPAAEVESSDEKSPECKSELSLELDVSAELDSDLCDDDSVSASEDSRNEADCSQEILDTSTHTEENESAITNGQQDDTISQSCETETSEVTQSIEVTKPELKTDDNSVSELPEVEPKVTQSAVSITSEQTMELESTNEDLP